MNDTSKELNKKRDELDKTKDELDKTKDELHDSHDFNGFYEDDIHKAPGKHMILMVLIAMVFKQELMINMIIMVLI